MSIRRRSLLGTVALAAAGSAQAALPNAKGKTEQPQQQLIDHWIIPHGGDCCGCAVSENVGTDEYQIVCNECGAKLDVLVSEITFNRMAEALQRAHHALSFSSGHIVHDGKPEHSYVLDHTKELRFIDEALKLADVGPRVLKPLT